MKRPTPTEVSEYAKSIEFVLDGEDFCDFYISKGWKVGSSPMVDWKAAVRTWKRKAGLPPIDRPTRSSTDTAATKRPEQIDREKQDMARQEMAFNQDIRTIAALPQKEQDSLYKEAELRFPKGSFIPKSLFPSFLVEVWRERQVQQ